MVMENLKHILPKKDQPLYIENEDIENCDIFKNKRFNLKNLAKVLVSERHEKAELEKLTFYLLCEIYDKNQ